MCLSRRGVEERCVARRAALHPARGASVEWRVTVIDVDVAELDSVVSLVEERRTARPIRVIATAAGVRLRDRLDTCACTRAREAAHSGWMKTGGRRVVGGVCDRTNSLEALAVSLGTQSGDCGGFGENVFNAVALALVAIVQYGADDVKRLLQIVAFALEALHDTQQLLILQSGIM